MEQQRTNTLSIISLILGILWLCGLGSLVAVITGHMARGKVKRDPTQKGMGLAMGGLILGYIGLVLTVGTVVLGGVGIAWLVDEAEKASKAITNEEDVRKVATSGATIVSANPEITDEELAAQVATELDVKVEVLDSQANDNLPRETIGVKVLDGMVCAATKGKTGSQAYWATMTTELGSQEDVDFSYIWGSGSKACDSVSIGDQE